MIKKELLTIEFKRTRDARSNYVEKATTAIPFTGLFIDASCKVTV
jgi:hypothetical protein